MTRLTRLERVLLNIIQQMQFTLALGPYGECVDWGKGSEQFEREDEPSYRLHFARWAQPRVGDIVFCETSAIGPWKVARVSRIITSSECLLENLRDGTMCRMSNEKFIPIVGLPEDALWTDEQVEFERKVIKSINHFNSYDHRYGGIDFEGDIAKIYIRQAFGMSDNRESVPYCVEVKWNKRTTIKFIVASLEAAGFGKRTFERRISPFQVGVSTQSGIARYGHCEFEVCEFSCREVIRGYNVGIYSNGGVDNLPRHGDSVDLCVATRNGERFEIKFSGVLESKAALYYKPGIKFLCSDMSIELTKENHDVE